MRKRKVGERVVIDGRVATVESKPAKHSGVQTVRYVDGRGLLNGFEWWDWQRLAAMPTAEEG